MYVIVRVEIIIRGREWGVKELIRDGVSWEEWGVGISGRIF